MRQLEDQDRQQATARCRLPADPPLKGHKFGRRLIRLAVNLARVVGLRPAERVLKIVWEWLGVKQQLPDWTTIRMWLLRVGVAALREPIEPADDWVWMADHSNQIGPEKALVVLGVRASQLPPPGETLKHEDVHLLTVRPGTAWKREDMAAVYRELAEQYGNPRAVLCDGAVELRDGAQCLQNQRSDTIVLQDFKHKAAIFLKAAVGDHPRFAEFNTQLGKTRSAIQQTELAHLTPPGQKPKARFMNLASTLDWAATVLWLLDHPEAKARDVAHARAAGGKAGLAAVVCGGTGRVARMPAGGQCGRDVHQRAGTVSRRRRATVRGDGHESGRTRPAGNWPNDSSISSPRRKAN